MSNIYSSINHLSYLTNINNEKSVYMENSMFSVDEIKELMTKLQETNLGKLKIKQGDFSLTIKAKEPQTVNTVQTVQAAPAPVVVSACAETVAAEQAHEAVIEKVCGNEVKSPIVGTYYQSAAPDKPAFVAVGSRVKKGDVLFIIESMKLMNEVQSEFDGEVAEIMVTDGQSVEYGQSIMIIK